MGDRPAPEAPDAATTTASGSASPAAYAGKSASSDDGRVAAGHGDAARAAQPLAVAGQLGQAVGPGAGVRGAVEVLPVGGVGQPEVGAAVDDEDVVAEPGRERPGLAVRQRQEDDVVPGEGLGRGLGKNPVGEWMQLRMVRTRAGSPRSNRRSASRSRSRGDLRGCAAAHRPHSRSPRRPPPARPSSPPRCRCLKYA